MYTLWVADAFTNTPFSGGPAGVCVFDEFPADAWMQNVASELGFSNSAFLKRLGPNHFHIRWFTPIAEAPICGHATIASMHVLVSERLVSSGATVVFESMRGKLYVSNDGAWYNMDFPSYDVIPLAEAGIDAKKVLGNIGCVSRARDLKGEGLKLSDTSHSSRVGRQKECSALNIHKRRVDELNLELGEVVYCGFANNIIMLEFFDEEMVRQFQPDLDAIKRMNCRAISVTAISNRYDFVTRYFAPRVGINEDPVCASSHCFLVPYWSKKLGKQDLISWQASARGALLKCKNLGNRVLISGEAVTVFKGNVSETKLREVKYVA